MTKPRQGKHIDPDSMSNRFTIEDDDIEPGNEPYPGDGGSQDDGDDSEVDS